MNSFSFLTRGRGEDSRVPTLTLTSLFTTADIYPTLAYFPLIDILALEDDLNLHIENLAT